MITVVFIEANGVRVKGSAEVGQSLMECAIEAGVAGIIARCGGGLNCLTCHCYPTGDKAALIPGADAEEQEVLPFVNGTRDNSRMACQIELTDDLDGLEVMLPKSQLNDDVREDCL